MQVVDIILPTGTEAPNDLSHLNTADSQSQETSVVRKMTKHQDALGGKVEIKSKRRVQSHEKLSHHTFLYKLLT